MAEKIILDVKVSGNNDLNRLELLLKDTNSSATTLRSTLESLKQQMISSQAATRGLTVGTEEYTRALLTATTAANNFRTANANIAASMTTTSNVNIGATMASSFTAVEAVLVALGQEVNRVTQGLIAMNNVVQSNIATQSIVATQAGFNAMRQNIQGVTSAANNMNATLAQTSGSIVQLNTNTGVLTASFQAMLNSLNLGDSSGLFIDSILRTVSSLEFNLEEVTIALNNANAALAQLTNNGLGPADIAFQTTAIQVATLKNVFDQLSTVKGTKILRDGVINLRDNVNSTTSDFKLFSKGVEGADIRLKELKASFDYAPGSINALKAGLNSLRSQFDALSESERRTDIDTYNLGQQQAATAQQVTEAQATISGRIALTNTQLNAANAAAGRAGSGYNGLAMAISQVGREIPNFFYSMQIGFMAISNNLPILVDELNRARAAGQSFGTAMKAAFSGGQIWMLALIILSTQLVKIIDSITAALNKIPTDIKINIEINNDAIKKTEDLRVKIAKFQSDYNKAQASGNKSQIKFLTEYANKEFGIHKDKLSRIMETTKSQKEYFDAYLKMAEDTYFNEAILKKKANLQVTGESSLQEAKELIKLKGGSLEGYMELAKKTGFEKMLVDISNIGVNQTAIDKLRVYFSTLKEIQNLPMFRSTKDYYNKPTNKPTTTGGSTSTPTQNFTTATQPDVASYEAAQANQLPTITKRFDEFYFEREQIIANSRDNTSKLYQDWELLSIEHAIKIEEAVRKDIISTQNFYNEKLEIAKNEVNVIYPEKVKAFDENEKLYKLEVESLNNLYIIKASIIDEAAKAEDKKNAKLNAAKTTAQKKAINDAWVIEKAGFDKTLKLNNQSIESSEDRIKVYKDTRATLNKELADLSKSPDEIQQIQEKLLNLDTQFANSIKNSTTLIAESIQAKLETVTTTLDAIGSFSDGIASYYQANQAQSDSYYDAEEANINNMNVSDEQRTKLLEDNEKARYEAKKDSFEKQKKWEIASAWMAFASGTVSIWSQSFKELGPIAGPIIAGIETAGLLATTLANVKTIKSQRLDAPSSASSSSSSASSSSAQSFIALTPNKTATTSKEETLNNLSSGKQSVTVVKVTDINNVQNKVSVRENNVNY